MRSHAISHTNPSEPENANAQRQPIHAATGGIARMASAPPTLDPLSKMATATLRSLPGNHSATVLLAPGQLNPSPMPSRKRDAAKPNTECAKPVHALTTDQNTTAIASPM